MRITVVSPLFPTEAERYRGNFIYNTVRSLQKHADLEVLCPRMSPLGLSLIQRASKSSHRTDRDEAPLTVSARHLEYPGFPIISRPLNSAVCQSVITSHVKGLNPDLILSYWVHPEGYAAVKVGRRLNVPVVVGALGSDLLLAKGIGKYSAKKAMRNADYVLTVSEDLRNAAIRLGAVPGRVRTIRNGCDSSIFYQRERTASRLELGVDPHARVILFVGHLIPLKGLPDLVPAFAQVRREFANAELMCIGEGPLAGFLRSNGVRVLGARASHEIAKWLGACDLLCLPSRSEGCPNVVVEALNSGRPVIATNVGGIPELVDTNSAILVPPCAPCELGDAISAGLKRPWDEAAIATRMSRSWDDVADETYDACRQVLSEYLRAA